MKKTLTILWIFLRTLWETFVVVLACTILTVLGICVYLFVTEILLNQ